MHSDGWLDDSCKSTLGTFLWRTGGRHYRTYNGVKEPEGGRDTRGHWLKKSLEPCKDMASKLVTISTSRKYDNIKLNMRLELPSWWTIKNLWSRIWESVIILNRFSKPSFKAISSLMCCYPKRSRKTQFQLKSPRQSRLRVVLKSRLASPDEPLHHRAFPPASFRDKNSTSVPQANGWHLPISKDHARWSLTFAREQSTMSWGFMLCQPCEFFMVVGLSLRNFGG